MKKYAIVGIFIIVVLMLPTIISTPVQANDTQYTGEIIIAFVIGKYTTVQRSLNFPFMTINITCEKKEVRAIGLEWFRPPGYSVSYPRFFFDNNITGFTALNFLGICRFHHIIGLLFPDNL